MIGRADRLGSVPPIGLDTTDAEPESALREIGKVAAAPMVNRGSVRGAWHVRLVFSNEPAEGRRARPAEPEQLEGWRVPARWSAGGAGV